MQLHARNMLELYFFSHKSQKFLFQKLVLVFRRVRKIAKSYCYLRHVCPSVRLSALMNI
jgi:hypothetical protein